MYKCPKCGSANTSKERNEVGADTMDRQCNDCGHTGHWKEFESKSEGIGSFPEPNLDVRTEPIDGAPTGGPIVGLRFTRDPHGHLHAHGVAGGYLVSKATVGYTTRFVADKEFVGFKGVDGVACSTESEAIGWCNEYEKRFIKPQ